MTTVEEAAAPSQSAGPRVVTMLALVTVAALLAYAFVVGRTAQVAADAAERAEIAREDASLCTALGFAAQDGRYIRCTDGLAQMRRRQKARWDAASQ